MTRLKIYLTLLLGIFLGPYLYANDASTLQTLLQGFKSFQANFSQRTLANTPSQAATGKLVILKPSRFWWFTEHPNKQYYISDGTTLWTYQVDLLQVTKSKLSDRIDNTPLALLSGKVTHIDQIFHIKQASAGHFILTPQSTDSLMKSITLIFKHGLLAQMILINHLDQATSIVFADVKLNQPVDTTLFDFTPPNGVDVMAQ